MNRKVVAMALGMLAAPTLAFAADHIDSPAAVASPNADITDVYAWMSDDAENVNLVMNVAPFASGEAAFSDAVTYAFHVNSATGYGADQTETLVICQFYAADGSECWVGDEYVEGDPGDSAGITSDSGALRVFAGMRNDPFFMEFTGFTATVDTVVSVAGDLTFDAAGCPAVDEATSNALVTQLQSGAPVEGQEELPAASDTFAGSNVLSIVLQIDKDLLTAGGPILGVWGSTHRAQ